VFGEKNRRDWTRRKGKTPEGSSTVMGGSTQFRRRIILQGDDLGEELASKVSRRQAVNGEGEGQRNPSKEGEIFIKQAQRKNQCGVTSKQGKGGVMIGHTRAELTGAQMWRKGNGGLKGSV